MYRVDAVADEVPPQLCQSRRLDKDVQQEVAKVILQLASKGQYSKAGINISPVPHYVHPVVNKLHGDLCPQS
jgi:hypothetical protein